MKTRFSPSPTGRIHLGNARTALFSYLASIAGQGTFLLRIEDTDLKRSLPEYTEGVQEDLHWLGIHWHEGPYFQSQRQAIYDDYYVQLQKSGHAYECFCSEDQLNLARKLQRTQGQAPRYPGTCRHLTATEVQQKKAQGLAPVLRFKLSPHTWIEFMDVIKGSQRFSSDDIGDFVIRRADGMASFMYCNAIDDALMGTTLVLRGEDHLTNTPRQLAILDALQLRKPDYGHISLVVAEDGSPFSKRHGSKSIQLLREEGFLSLAIVNYLARLGHAYDSTALLSMAELGQAFHVDALSKSSSRFDMAQLLFWQKEAVLQLDEAAFWQWSGTQRSSLFFTSVRTNVLFPKDVYAWEDIFFKELVYSESTLALLREAGREFWLAALSANSSDFGLIADAVKSATGKKGKALFMPLRLALTGVEHGPEMAKVTALLGEAVRVRLQQALEC